MWYRNVFVFSMHFKYLFYYNLFLQTFSLHGGFVWGFCHVMYFFHVDDSQIAIITLTLFVTYTHCGLKVN